MTPAPCSFCGGCGCAECSHTGQAEFMRARIAAEIRRCDREIAAMRRQTNKPAWLVTLGIEDWEREKRILMREKGGQKK